MSLNNDQLASALRELGWRVRTTNELTQAIANFQRGWNLGVALKVTGLSNAATSNAVKVSLARARKDLPTASAHFSFTEFACKCGGAFTSCPRIWIKRTQLARLEMYRAKTKAGVSIISGCRCAGHNAKVGGASGSRHKSGDASDVRPTVDKDTLRGWGIFTGIGYNASSDLAAHVDCRPGSVKTPTIWRYGR